MGWDKSTVKSALELLQNQPGHGGNLTEMGQDVEGDFGVVFASGFYGFGNILGDVGADCEEIGEDGDVPGTGLSELGDGIGDEGVGEFEKAAGELVKLTVGLVGNSLGEGTHFVV